MTPPYDTVEQRATVGRMTQQGFAVVSRSGDGHLLLLARGSAYQVSSWDMLLTALSPLVAVVAVPLGVALLARWPTR